MENTDFKMMKYIFITCMLCFANIAFSQIHFAIEGSVNREQEGDKVYLIMVEEDNRLADSTIVVDGRFHFEGELMRPCWAVVKANKAETAFIVLENGTIRLHTDKNSFQCGGTPTNEAFKISWQAFQELNRKQMKLREAFDTIKVEKEKKQELYLKYKETQRDTTRKFLKETIDDNLTNIVPAFWIRNLHEYLTSEETNTILAEASPVLKENHFIRKIVSVQPGNPFIDMNIENPKGEKLKLSEVIGKGNYTLINIWASWCGACIAELPKIKAAEEKYSSKGLRIIGLSIDRETIQWKKALNRLKLPWKQLHADYTFVNTYGINQIPVLILISPSGIIVKQKFEIEELEQLLK